MFEYSGDWWGLDRLQRGGPTLRDSWLRSIWCWDEVFQWFFFMEISDVTGASCVAMTTSGRGASRPPSFSEANECPHVLGSVFTQIQLARVSKVLSPHSSAGSVCEWFVWLCVCASHTLLFFLLFLFIFLIEKGLYMVTFPSSFCLTVNCSSWISHRCVFLFHSFCLTTLIFQYNF